MPGLCASTLLVRAAAFLPFAENLAVGELIPWLAQVRDLNLKAHVVPEVLAMRRLHETNLGRSARDQRRDYLVGLKEVLDRRRKPAGES